MKDPDRVSEHLHMHLYTPASSPNLLQPPPGAEQIQPLVTRGTDDDSATVDPQSRVSDRSRSPPRKERPQEQGPQKQKGKKPIAEMKKPSELPKAKKHKLPIVPVLPLHQEPTASSQEPAASSLGPAANSADEDSECSNEYSARSHASGRTVLHPDLYVLSNDQHWTVTPETHKHAAAAGSFCFVTTENGERQNVSNLITMPCVQRPLCLDNVTNNFGSTKVEVPKGVDSRTRDMLERFMDSPVQDQPHLIRVSGQWLCSGKKTRDVSPN